MPILAELIGGILLAGVFLYGAGKLIVWVVNAIQLSSQSKGETDGSEQ